MKEGPYQRRILDMARRFGWKAWHVPAPMRWTKKGWVPAKEARGLPALILLHDDPPRMIIAVSLEGGKLSDEQMEFLQMARDVAEIATAANEWTAMYEERDNVLGVYVFTPEQEKQVEQMLRTKVLM